MAKRLFTLIVLLYLAGVLFAADPKPGIRFPELIAPSPKIDLVTVPKLTPDVLYIIDSDVPVIVLASPAGLVNITEETGPIRVRGRFVEAPSKVQSRTFSGKQVFTIEPIEGVKGRVELLVIPAEKAKLSDVIRKTVDVDSGNAPLPPPKPDDPPTPKPPDPPKPDPSPIPVAGFRVLIVYESADKAKMPLAQLSILTSRPIRDYLKSKCAADSSAEIDGKAYRIWDKDASADAPGLEAWREAMKRPRTSVPWILISNHPHGGYEGPLPANVTDTLALLKKYAESAKVVR